MSLYSSSVEVQYVFFDLKSVSQLSILNICNTVTTIAGKVRIIRTFEVF